MTGDKFNVYFKIIFFVISAIIIKEMLSGNKDVIVLVTSGVFIPYLTKKINF